MGYYQQTVAIEVANVKKLTDHGVASDADHPQTRHETGKLQ